MLPAQTPEGSLNSAFAATAASVAAGHDLRFRKEGPLWTPERHRLQDAVGAQAAISNSLFMVAGGLPKQERTPAQAMALEVSNAALSQLDAPPSFQSLTGHTLTAIPGANGALVTGGTGHHGISFISPDGLQELSCSGFPALVQHTATLLSCQSSLPCLVAVLGGLFAATQQPNSAAFLLIVSRHRGHIQITCQELMQVRHTNSLTSDSLGQEIVWDAARGACSKSR